MAESDPLDGFRAPLNAVAMQVEQLSPESALWQRLYLGDAASKIMRGVAERTDIAKVMAHMVAQCELDAQAACRALIAESDMQSADARKAHFDARISAEILGRLNQYINDGLTAAHTINSHGESA
jgi:hypothetical protein